MVSRRGPAVTQSHLMDDHVETSYVLLGFGCFVFFFKRSLCSMICSNIVVSDSVSIIIITVE